MLVLHYIYCLSYYSGEMIWRTASFAEPLKSHSCLQNVILSDIASVYFPECQKLSVAMQENPRLQSLVVSTREKFMPQFQEFQPDFVLGRIMPTQIETLSVQILLLFPSTETPVVRGGEGTTQPAVKYRIAAFLAEQSIRLVNFEKENMCSILTSATAATTLLSTYVCGKGEGLG